MKNRFTTLDLRASIVELQEKYKGMRVMNVYDVDSKTYLIKLAKPEAKATILLESGIRIHSTEFEWPKNVTPSSFSMKLRKHLRTRRLEKIEQLGIDRIIDIQFGSSDAAYHVILELYDRGNIVLTDHEYKILNILRPRTDQSEDVKFVVNEKYPVESAKQPDGIPTQESIVSILMEAKEGDNLKKVLIPKLVYGPALIEHALLVVGVNSNAKIGKDFNMSEDLPKLMTAMEKAEEILLLSSQSCKGFITQKKEKKPAVNSEEETTELLTFVEYHPFLFKQHENHSYVEVESFDKAVDEFYSKIGSQKLDMKTLQQERQALKKLEHIKKDHEKRLEGLKQDQDVDMNKAGLIELNLDLVDRAIVVVQSAIANQIDWEEIHAIVKEAQLQGDPVASAIKSLKLDTNHIVMFLKHPYMDSDEEADTDSPDDVTPMKVDIDLELTAYANARKYYDKKRKAAAKEQKTIDVSAKALKSAERKTFQTLKEVQTVATINKARKTFWFEKFLWFISSENYVVIGGRDQQQNELIVKKYLRPGDLYVHADLHGASSVIIKNQTGVPVPPKTLNEAGTMALCNSAAWDAKVVTSAWWVYHHQVSKTAPTGEYLTTGSFMIRGKKNFLPPSYLVYGFGFMFKVDEECVFRHKDERRIRTLEDDNESVSDSVSGVTEDNLDLDMNSGSDDDDDDGSHNDDRSDTDRSRKLTTNETVEIDNVDLVEDLSKMKIEKSEFDVIAENDVGVSAGIIDKSNDSAGAEFPDTNIDLRYVQGEKLQVKAGRYNSRTISAGSVDDRDEDDQGTSGKKSGARLSAKQRRELKKKGKGDQPPVTSTVHQVNKPETVQLVKDNANDDDVNDDDVNDDDAKDEPKLDKALQPESARDKPSQPESAQDKPSQPESARDKPSQSESARDKPSQSESASCKRRLKAKLKKIKEKYADQDEEERQMRMEILGSAGAPKEDKRKAKKAKQHGQTKKQVNANLPAQTAQRQFPHRKLTVEDIKEESVISTAGTDVKDEDAHSDEEKQNLLDEENIKLGEDMNELDSLTGIPVPEDILHFCIPVCGPYSAMTNYKYKVKLTPGSTKRGKAGKLAVHNFLHDRSTTNREKDLFKSLKDVDVSRNIPGKVKVSAPNLLKQKKK